jgi:hypothetical protein
MMIFGFMAFLDGFAVFLLGSLVHAVIIWGWWFTGKKEWEIKFEISI